MRLRSSKGTARFVSSADLNLLDALARRPKTQTDLDPVLTGAIRPLGDQC